MQIRIRKNTVSLVRTVYDPQLKRGRSEQLGSLPKDATSVPETILARLDDAERNSLNVWLAVNEQLQNYNNRQKAATGLPDMLREIAAWYRQQPKSQKHAALAKASRAQWTEVLVAMSTVGVGRTRNRASKKKPAEAGS